MKNRSTIKKEMPQAMVGDKLYYFNSVPTHALNRLHEYDVQVDGMWISVSALDAISVTGTYANVRFKASL